ncbi:exonuclease 1 isoform X2 [Impatiens glandulifera]|nr:exonuclease 1 isoform X2 [Impatiens glandulifera]
MHRVNLLRHFGVKPVLVFDGGHLPMKSDQESKRARSRKENLERAIEHESNGNSSAAYECYQKAVDISPSVAYDLIQVLKKENVCYIVAPYEADAQMTFLAVSKQVDAVITEDSDLIAFGCPRIIYKMDKFGQGVEFRYSKLEQNKDLNLTGFTKQMILEMCILSGCDYLQSLPGMGLKKAYAIIKKFKDYKKVIKHLKYSTTAVSPGYEESFRKAILTFQHQRVYDPSAEDIVHLSDLTDVEDELDFLGPSMPQDIAIGVATGDLDPFTKMPIQVSNNKAGAMVVRTTQMKVLKPESEKKKLILPAQSNILTKYFCIASIEAKRKFVAPRNMDRHQNHIVSTKDIVHNPMPENLDNKRTRTHFIHKPCTTILHNTTEMESEREAILVEDDGKVVTLNNAATESKIRSKCRKPVIRSSYFPHSSKKETDSMFVNKEVKEIIATCQHVSPIPENVFYGDNSLTRTETKTPTKRKPPPPQEIVQLENLANKRSRNDAPPIDEPIDEAPTEKYGGEKFGCNISHLENYSDIAEKSMEKFVSIMSSFKYSPGSRASGLRAPLRDAHKSPMRR